MEQTGKKVSLALDLGAMLCYVIITVSLVIIAIAKLFSGNYFQFIGLTVVVGLLLMIASAIMSAAEEKQEK